MGSRVIVELPVVLTAEQPLVDVLALAAPLAARGREVGDQDARQVDELRRVPEEVELVEVALLRVRVGVRVRVRFRARVRVRGQGSGARGQGSGLGLTCSSEKTLTTTSSKSRQTHPLTAVPCRLPTR